MRTFVLLILLLAVLTPSAALAKTFGQGISLSDETAISSIIDNPVAYVGKKVKVSGFAYPENLFGQADQAFVTTGLRLQF